MFKLGLFFGYLSTLSLALVPLPQANVIHPTSGLALQYLSQYSPADSIIPLTVSIPLTTDMCYFLPLHVLEKIHSCRQSKSNNTPRTKRLISEIIAIGMGTAALTISTANSIQINQNMKTITKSLEIFAFNTTTQLFHLQEGELKLALVLNHTQMALNQTANIINYHSITLEHLETFARNLDNRLTTFIHSVEAHFLHASLSDIFSNRLNLHFIHHRDLNAVVQFIISSTNITFRNNTTGPVLVDLVSRLLVQQAIQFLPYQQKINSTLGVLSITSFFAANKRNQTSFNVYQLIPIPFSHSGMRVRLADFPAAIGIDFQRSRLIKWTSTEVLTCDFQTISVCRETPPIITKWQDTCLYQILTDSILSQCRIDTYNDLLFLHQMGRQWLISTNDTQKCHFSVFSTSDPPYIIQDTVRTLPPVTLITIPPTTTLICERFSIQASPEVFGPPLVIWDLSMTEVAFAETLNLNHYLNNDTRWPKIPYISDEFRAIYNFLANTSITNSTPGLQNFHRHPFEISVILAIIILTILMSIMFYCIFACRPRLPSIYLPISTTSAPSTTT
jgi:hypothetical protein